VLSRLCNCFTSYDADVSARRGENRGTPPARGWGSVRLLSWRISQSITSKERLLLLTHGGAVPAFEQTVIPRVQDIRVMTRETIAQSRGAFLGATASAFCLDSGSARPPFRASAGPQHVCSARRDGTVSCGHDRITTQLRACFPAHGRLRRSQATTARAQSKLIV
jgi:hypothetical protein